MLKEYVVVEFKGKFYAQNAGVAHAIYNPDNITITNGSKVTGLLRSNQSGTFVHI